MARQAPQIAGLILAVLHVSGCASSSGDGETSGLQLPKLPSVSDLAPAAPDQPAGSATELYARIARGANACWFAANGPLKKAYIYHAEADAPSRGGKAEITIHQRDPSQANPRGPKAYYVRILPEAESAKIETQNVAMPDQAATEMQADVERWSRGEQGCIGKSTAADWAPQAPAPVAASAPGKPKSKKKAKAAKVSAQSPAQ